MLGDKRIDASTIIWAAGVKASPAAEWIGREHDRAGRIVVGPDLSVPNQPDIFVIGDLASVSDRNGKPVPGRIQFWISPTPARSTMNANENSTL